MSAEIQVRRIAFDGYILEFVVKDSNTVEVNLLTDKDPTMVDTSYIAVSSTRLFRTRQIDGTMEDFDVFSIRLYSETQAWAKESIVEDRESKILADTLRNVLPKSIET